MVAGEAELAGRVQLQGREPAGRHILEEAHIRTADGNCSQGNKMDLTHYSKITVLNPSKKIFS